MDTLKIFINEQIETATHEHFYVEAVTALNIFGNFSYSKDSINWIDVQENSIKIPKGTKLYIYTKEYLKNIKFSGKFSAGGDLFSVYQKKMDPNNRTLLGFIDGFADSDIVSAKELYVSYISKGISGLFKRLFANCKNLKYPIQFIDTDELASSACFEMYLNCNKITKPTIFRQIGSTKYIRTGRLSLQDTFKGTGIKSIPKKYFTVFKMCNGYVLRRPLDVVEFSGMFADTPVMDNPTDDKILFWFDNWHTSPNIDLTIQAISGK